MYKNLLSIALISIGVPNFSNADSNTFQARQEGWSAPYIVQQALLLNSSNPNIKIDGKKVILTADGQRVSCESATFGYGVCDWTLKFDSAQDNSLFSKILFESLVALREKWSQMDDSWTYSSALVRITTISSDEIKVLPQGNPGQSWITCDKFLGTDHYLCTIDIDELQGKALQESVTQSALKSNTYAGRTLKALNDESSNLGYPLVPLALTIYKSNWPSTDKSRAGFRLHLISSDSDPSTHENLYSVSVTGELKGSEIVSLFAIEVVE